MNIVILTHYLPYPLSSGGAQGQYNVIDQLRQRHNITLIFNEGSGNTRQAMKQLQQLWPEVKIIVYPYIRQLGNLRFLRDKAIRAFQIAFAPHSRKLLIDRQLKPYGQWFSKDQIKFVNEIIAQQKPDVIQVDFYQCLPWINYLPKNVKKVFIHHEIGFIRTRRILQSFQLTEKETNKEAMSKKEEIENLNKYDRIITVTDIDKKILEDHHVTRAISVSPSAINTQPLPYIPWKGKLVFVGGYNHLPNREGIDWFIKEIAPLLPETKLDIIGVGWPKSYHTTINKTEITLRGFIQDLSDVAYGNIMIVPLLTGSGMRMKILEAGAMSLPILTTSVGVEGLLFKDKESCLIADSPKDFAKAIELLFEDEQMREKLGKNARKVFDSHYSIEVLTRLREDILKDVLKQTS